MALGRGKSPQHNRTVKYWLLMESYEDVLYVHVIYDIRNKKSMSSRSYILQSMLYQSLKSIYYRTLLILQNKKTTDLRVKTWGGIKDMLSPPCQNMGGGDISPPSPPPWFTPLTDMVISHGYFSSDRGSSFRHWSHLSCDCSRVS